MLSSQKSPTVIVLIGVSALIWAFAIITLMPSLGGTIDVQAHEVCTHEIGTWEAVSTAPYAHVEGTTATIGDKVYIISGFYDYSDTLLTSDRVDVYNVATGVWETANNPRQPAPFSASHMNAAVEGQYIWMAGGFDGEHPGPAMTHVWRYDTVNDSWWRGPDLPEGRAFGGLVIVGRELHFLSGVMNDRRTDATDHWVLDLDNATSWELQAPIPRPRNHYQAVVIGTTIYLVGGQSHHIRSIDRAWLDAYDTVTKTWTSKSDLPDTRSHAEMGTFVANGKIIIAGGRSEVDDENGYLTNEGQVSRITEYDPEVDTWSQIGQLPKDLISPLVTVSDGKIIATLGGINWQTPQRETWVADITPCNELPVSQADRYEVQVGATLTINAATGVLQNDTDADNDTLTARLQRNVAKGTLTLNTNGSFSYTPNAGVSGTDSFTYYANDGRTDSETPATVTIRLVTSDPNQPPVAQADHYEAQIGETLTIDAAGGVLQNDSDADSDGLTAQLQSDVTKGTLILNSDGSFSYTPELEAFGFDTFSYYANDGDLNSATPAIVSIRLVNPAGTPPRLYPLPGQTLTSEQYDWPAFQFRHIEGVEWYGIWIGPPDGSYTGLFAWFPATQASSHVGNHTPICDTSTRVCTLPVDVWLWNSDYVWWMTYWGSDMQESHTYWNETTFRIEFTTPQDGLENVTPADTVSEAPSIVTWTRDPNVMWMHIWLGQPVGARGIPHTAFYGWIDATEHCDQTTCTLDLSEASLPDGNYQIWVELWGPAGYLNWFEVNSDSPAATFNIDGNG